MLDGTKIEAKKKNFFLLFIILFVKTKTEYLQLSKIFIEFKLTHNQNSI
jgi:hypothetical protein